ncbi:hypothetical protein SAMN05428981_1121 [Bacillus sp. OV194]|nr:hypothetical protein SAMN05428981_1121 [Bacillus sp. OV194]
MSWLIFHSFLGLSLILIFQGLSDQPLIQAVKPFFTTAAEICSLWQKARIVYKKLQMERPLEALVPDVIQAFKITFYQYKLCKIKSTFPQYFYSVLYIIIH